METASLVLNILSTIALIATLLVVWDYTSATHKIARLQEEEVGLRKTPTVMVTIDPDRQYELLFRTLAHNLSNVHAAVRVVAKVRWAGKDVEFTDEFYTGQKDWLLQAHTGILGHLSLGDKLSEQEINDKGEKRVILYSKVRNYSPTSEHKGRRRVPKWSINPPVEYYWKDSSWVPEAAPRNSDLSPIASREELSNLARIIRAGQHSS